MKYNIICAIFIFSHLLYSQKAPIRKCEYINSNLNVIVKAIDSVYSYKDTLNVEITYHNIGKIDVYIFNFCYTEWKEPKSSYVFEIGGNFLLKLGVKQYIKLKRIKPGETFVRSYAHYLDPNNKTNNNISLLYYYEAENVSTFNCEFYIGYLLKNSDYDLDYLDKDGFLSMKGNKEALLFEKIIKRIYLGPIWFKIYN